MPALTVAFDTNSYRALRVSRLQAIQARERAQGVVPLAAFHTLLELVAGSIHPDEKEARFRTGALKRLYHHCTGHDGYSPNMRYLAFSDAQAAFNLFGVRSTKYESMAKPLLRLAHYQATREDQTWGPHRELVEFYRDYRDETERQFASIFFDKAVKSVAPDATAWADAKRPSAQRDALLARADKGHGLRVLGRSIAQRAATHVSLSLSDAELDAAAERARRQYPVSIALLDSLISDVIRNGRNMARPENSNSVWDYEISFSIGHRTTIMDVPVFLVTGDTDILTAAERVSALNVYSLDAYEALLALPYDEFRATVDASVRAR